MYVYYYHEKFKAVELACPSCMAGYFIYISTWANCCSAGLLRDWFRVHDVHVCWRLLISDFQQMRAAVIYYQLPQRSRKIMACVCVYVCLAKGRRCRAHLACLVPDFSLYLYLYISRYYTDKYSSTYECRRNKCVVRKLSSRQPFSDLCVLESPDFRSVTLFLL